MNPMFAQTTPGGTGGNAPVIEFPTVDWSTLIPQLVGYFFDAIGKLLNDTVRSSFSDVWTTGSSVLDSTDMSMTWGLGPVSDQVQTIQGAARVILVFALIVLGLRGILASIIPRQPDMLAEFINGVLAAVIMLAAFPLLVPEFIRFTNQAAAAIGRANLSGYVSSVDISNPLVQAMLFVILVFFAFRLLIKAVWRVGFLAVLLPVGMLACALYALPQTRWLLGWWARAWGGMLLAQVPSVLALSIGAQFFARGGGGVVAFLYSIAFLQLATDLYSLIPFGTPGVDGPPWALAWPAHVVAGHGRGMLGGVGGLAAGVAAGGLAAGAASGRVGGQMYGYQ